MKIRFNLLKKYYFDEPKCKRTYQGIYIFCLKIGSYGINWFTDCGDWFIYIDLGKRFGVRFSNAGFLMFKDGEIL